MHRLSQLWPKESVFLLDNANPVTYPRFLLVSCFRVDLILLFMIQLVRGFTNDTVNGGFDPLTVGSLIVAFLSPCHRSTLPPLINIVHHICVGTTSAWPGEHRICTPTTSLRLADWWAKGPCLAACRLCRNRLSDHWLSEKL